MKPMTKCILIHEPLHANDAAVFAQSETHLQNLCDCFLAWSSTWRKLSLSYEWSSSILGNDRTSSMWSTSCRNKVFAKHLCDTSWWNALREFCKTVNVEALLIWTETSATMAGHMTRMPEERLVRWVLLPTPTEKWPRLNDCISNQTWTHPDGETAEPSEVS